MRPNTLRAKFSIVSLYLIIGISVVYAFSLVCEIYMISRILSGGTLTTEQASIYSILIETVFVVFFVLYAVCAIAFILWFTRAYRNLQILMPNSKFYYKPCAAVVTWFIPVWNLFGPYNIATNLFDKTERYLVNEERMDLRPKYDITKGWWWALWIMSSVVIRMSEHYTAGNLYSNLGRMATVIGFIISILCAFFAIKMIKNYSEMEALILSPDGQTIDFLLSDDDLLDSGV